MKFILIIMLIPHLAFGLSSGPLDEKTGAPGENNCTQCHNDFPVNSGNGLFSISGPATFNANQTYQMSAELQDPGQTRWGFELTSLAIGDINITDPVNTQKSVTNQKTYIKHTLAGTFAGTADGPVTWNFEWTAPSDPPDSVVFYAAGNASNFNSTTSGDFIYTTQFVSKLESTHINSQDNLLTILPNHISLFNYPNPFNSKTTIYYKIPKSGLVELSIYDLSGRLINKTGSCYQEKGAHSVTWNAGAVSSGIYIYNIKIGGLSNSGKMILLK